MKIEVDFGSYEEVLADIDFEAALESFAKEESLPGNSYLSISFVSDEAIAEINKEFRNKDGSTDVLSFECDGISDEMEIGHEIDGCCDEQEALPFVLGDIIISVPTAQQQSLSYDITFKEELNFLILHGFLHLCGYDHIDDMEAKEMESRESELFQKVFHKSLKR